MKQTILTLRPTPPYDFNLTAAHATFFRKGFGADTFEDGVFRQLLDMGECLYLISVRSLGTVDSPALEVEITGNELDCAVTTQIRQQVAWILGTDQDLAPFYHIALQDQTLAPLIQALRGLHLPHTASVYEALILAILGQQINSHVAHLLRRLLVQAYGPTLEVSGATYLGFPRPGDLATAGVDGLCAVKLSTRKAQYIADISTSVVSGQLNLEELRTCSDEEVIHTLTSIRGVGLWTVHWLFILALGRADGFPHGDLALCRVLGQLLNTNTPLSPQAALDYSRRWSPFRSYVTAYIFAAIRSGMLR